MKRRSGVSMKRAEVEKLAEQGQHTLDKAERYRAAAQRLDDGDVDKARLLAAAKAIEITGLEWTQVVRDLATGR